MPYTEGAHDSPADTNDRLSRVGTKYQATPDTVSDGDNVYLAVDSSGRLIVVGSGVHDSATPANALIIGAEATTDISAESVVDTGDAVRLRANRLGALIIAGGVSGSDGIPSSGTQITDDTGSERPLATLLYGVAPDTAGDRIHTARDSAPGKGALDVAPIGGDLTLRASAVAGEASGTSTAEDNLGWVKSFNAHLDVTAAPSGGAPTLDVYLQTQLASGDWQDIAHFTQATGVTAEIVDWGRSDGNFSGLGAEGAAVTYDRFFAEQDGGLAAATIRVMNLGDSMRVKWVFAAGGSSGDFTFAVTTTPHS